MNLQERKAENTGEIISPVTGVTQLTLNPNGIASPPVGGSQ